MRLFVSVMTLIFTSFVFLSTPAVSGSVQPTSYHQIPVNSTHFSSLVMQNDTGAWYYQINKGSKILILQKNIPAVSENIAFQDSIQAAKVADLVLMKLEKGIFPPGLYISELDSLKIHY
ncbi:MAG: DUF4907 domain-containing protein [Bacteroidales bacterium]|nr:DUF4907 domain-containing protein [Bacteroidales bacterium]